MQENKFKMQMTKIIVKFFIENCKIANNPNKKNNISILLTKMHWKEKYTSIIKLNRSLLPFCKIIYIYSLSKFLRKQNKMI